MDVLIQQKSENKLRSIWYTFSLNCVADSKLFDVFLVLFTESLSPDVLFLGLWYGIKECPCTRQFTRNELKCQSSQLFCQKTHHDHCMELPGSCGKLSESPSWDREDHGEPAWSPINKTHWALSAHYLVMPNKELSQRERLLEDVWHRN